MIMGMYDEIAIDSKILPISKKDRKKFIGHIWQTKSLDRMLHRYVVTKKGKIKGLDPHYKKKKKIGINFYTYYNSDEWWEFHAVFENGKLTSIIGGLTEDAK
jgi:hypothetical protein